MRLTRQECLDRAGLYEEAAEHIAMCWDQVPATKPALDFVERHLRRELEKWEVRASRVPTPAEPKA